MEFVIITVAIMTISILLIYKISQYMNIDINLQPLILCGILALLVNFSALTVSSYLSPSHFILLGALVLISSTVATWYNQRLIHIHEADTALTTAHEDVPAPVVLAAETDDDSTPADEADATVEEEEVYDEDELNAALKKGLLDILTPVPEDEVTAKPDDAANQITAEPANDTEPSINIEENTSDSEEIPAEVKEISDSEEIPAEVEEISDSEEIPAEVEEISDTEEITAEAEEISDTENDSADVIEEELTVALEDVNEIEDSTVDVVDEVNADEAEESVEVEDSTVDVVDEVNADEAEDSIDIEDSTVDDVDEVIADEAEDSIDIEDNTVDIVNEVIADEAEEPVDIEDTSVDVVEEAIADEAEKPVDIEDTSVDVVDEVITDEAKEPVDIEDNTIDDDDVDAELWNTVAAMETLDDILDYAFEQKTLNENSKALYAYSEALRIYRDDSYAPFIAIDMINICKAVGNYDKALRIYDEALRLPAVVDNPDMQQEFINIRSYLT